MRNTGFIAYLHIDNLSRKFQHRTNKTFEIKLIAIVVMNKRLKANRIRIWSTFLIRVFVLYDRNVSKFVLLVFHKARHC